MKRILSAIIFSAVLSAAAFCVTVNEVELKSAGEEQTIVFENYQGPHSVIETVDAINSIGTELGKKTAADTGKAGEINRGAKYSVIHAIDPESEGKLDADILIIGESASVDHIRNLRRIIASYLEAAYGYERKDAMTIATFVTVYNAVYRGNLDNFKTKYKDVVVKNLDEKKCGLSIKWNEWPGKSQIVIPLGEYRDGGLSSVDTSVISDKTVVNSMKEEDDKGIDERKNMVDIKEREAENAELQAMEAAKNAAQANKELSDQKKEQQKAEAEARQAASDYEKAQKEADADPENKEKQDAAIEASKKASEAKDKAEEEKKETSELEQKAQEASKEAEERQQFADRKTSEAQGERTDIAKDQQYLIQKEMKENNEGTVIGLKIADSSKNLCAIVKINSTTGAVSKESPVKVIRGRTIFPVQGTVQNISTGTAFPTSSPEDIAFYIAICGENSGKGAVKLCLIDAYRMEIQQESSQTIAEDSVLVNQGGSYYAVVSEKGSNYLGKFDSSVNLVMKSEMEVSAKTPITVTGHGIIVTDNKGNPVLLSLADLKQVK